MRLDILEVGDIVRVWRLYVTNFGYVDETAWCVVTNADGSFSGTVNVEVFFGPTETWDEPELDEADQCRRVSETRVPNYVSAALARWRLTGEKSTVRMCHAH